MCYCDGFVESGFAQELCSPPDHPMAQMEALGIGCDMMIVSEESDLIWIETDLATIRIRMLKRRARQ